MGSKRRHYGTGVVERPKGSGNFYARVIYRGRQHWKRAANKSHALALYHEMKAAIRKGQFPPSHTRSVPFDELLADYREAKRRDGKSVMASNIGYRRVLERFGGRRADEIATVEVDQWRRELEQKRLAPATVNLHLCLLRAILRHGVRAKRIDGGALPAIDRLKTNNQRVRYLSEDEENRLVAALPEWLKPLVTVAIHTGMRRGELLRLTWKDVDFAQGIIWVRVSKSGEGRRISMNSTVRRTLSALRDERRKRLSQKVVVQTVTGLSVFVAPAGGFLWNLARVWYQAVRTAGITDLHFHDLRHTFASRLAMRHVDLNTIRVLLGHKSLAMTYRYAHFDPEYLAAAVATLDAPGPKPWAMAAQGR